MGDILDEEDINVLVLPFWCCLHFLIDAVVLFYVLCTYSVFCSIKCSKYALAKTPVPLAGLHELSPFADNGTRC